MCGSLRMVYAFIYTLFLVSRNVSRGFRLLLIHLFTPQGFGLTFGSELYLAISKYGRQNLGMTAAAESEFLHGHFLTNNASAAIQSLGGTFMFLDTTSSNTNIIKGEPFQKCASS